MAEAAQYRAGVLASTVSVFIRERARKGEVWCTALRRELCSTQRTSEAGSHPGPALPCDLMYMYKFDFCSSTTLFSSKGHSLEVQLIKL